MQQCGLVWSIVFVAWHFLNELDVHALIERNSGKRAASGVADDCAAFSHNFNYSFISSIGQSDNPSGSDKGCNHFYALCFDFSAHFLGQNRVLPLIFAFNRITKALSSTFEMASNPLWRGYGAPMATYGHALDITNPLWSTFHL
jgi:hypothetical protein